MRKQEKEEQMEIEAKKTSSDIFNKLRFERKYCDVLIKVGNAEFHAHRNILSRCSQYLSDLFTPDENAPNEHQYHIPDVSPEIMELIMEYAYTERINIRERNVHELLISADYLGVSDLVNECSAFLKAQLCLENCIGIWHFAGFYSCRKLEQQAFQFILLNFEEMVSVSEDFLDLTVKQLNEIIGSDKLNVKQENVVFEAILQWIEHVPQNRKAHIEVLLPRVRMGLLTCDYLINNVRRNAVVADNAAFRMILISILKSMAGLIPKESLSPELTRPRLPSAILMAIGGWSNRRLTNAIEVYDTRADCWVNVTCDGESPRAHHGTEYLNGFVYCIGGWDGMNNSSSVRRFNPITRTWAQVGNMCYSRCYLSTCVLDGRIYAMGGSDGHERLNTAERYEPESNQWSTIAPMHMKRSDAGATVLNGKVYICGGFYENDCLSTAECYNPQTEQWTLIPAMTSSRNSVGVMAYCGEIYAVGGYGGDTFLRDAEAYNPETNSWRPIADMHNKRRDFGIEVVDDLLYVVGGHDGFTTINKVECYDKRTGEWHEVKDMGISRRCLSCCVLSGLANMAEYTAPRDQRLALKLTPDTSRSSPVHRSTNQD